ncbi:hypothetical protein T440DRAFT_474779 [Plenodomus tracheiphilus IPT5]|uniref:N-acetyltransferase domain-containing protein n=1 Tax=Plenodomus tracheiphilus IPT5 TaxID=1408161 RepID=A0A6A7BMM2_9PLEO|nr:hypothetical protein T440DRAFT_474779 [Plenodomus tracheiphilus IPT5]
MPLVLLPITPSDTLSWTRIRTLAYAGPTHNLLHSNTPVTESSLHLAASSRTHELTAPNTWHWKIVDTDLPPSTDDTKDSPGMTIAIAVWSLKNVTSPTPTSETNPPNEAPPQPYTPPNLRLDALSSLLTPLRTAQLAIMGTKNPYFMLHSLATHPAHEGRGAGTKLLEWGIKKADEEGLVTYLDCTARARSMYERRGWELVRECVWDRGVWGGEGKDWYGCMVRKPRGC